MHRTKSALAPVVTILSPSPSASRKAQSLLQALVGLDPVDISISADDELNKVFESAIPSFSRQWDSVVSRCNSSGSLVHFCAMEGSQKQTPLSLIGVTDTHDDASTEKIITSLRQSLASKVENRATSMAVKSSLGMGVSAKGLLQSVSSGGLPMLLFPHRQPSTDDHDREIEKGQLKEIVIPHFDYATYKDGSTLSERISGAGLRRIVVGLYNWTGSNVNIRPLPTAAEDQRLPTPSLIFHGEGPSKIDDSVGVKTAKIGFGGSRTGQVMLAHPDLDGLDLRYCPQTTCSSAFSEAQDSLLAASLDELQSANTLLTGGEQGKTDTKTGQGDCWVEVRANLKRPSGFWTRKRATVSKPRIAKAPDIPFE